MILGGTITEILKFRLVPLVSAVYVPVIYTCGAEVNFLPHAWKLNGNHVTVLHSKVIRYEQLG